MSDFTQLDEHLRNAPLRAIAVLSLEPDDFFERSGIVFTSDDRGTVAALLQIHADQQYMLVRHVDAAGPGVEVLASERSAHPRQDLQDFLDALKLDAGVVTWMLDEPSRVADPHG